ncbi:PDZ domain-containing protein [Streptomyces sp. AJS327]|uniref:YlbL family protein n=1 Tax=Streptomyces sp. AJS327 TaxID=2545265 RepID=UPI0015E03C10|nr:PDZ domain-containing protein [Streptomyces sp. AJS327]MBA0051486.1 PDZ domain-containing protein [Streptomyces sp. AJS327]
MPRRTATLLTSTLLLIALLCAAALITVPYAQMSPGPTVNTLGDHDGEPVLSIKDRPVYPADGHLNMTTVRVTGADYRMNLVEAVSGWLRRDSAVVPYKTLYPERKSAEEVDEENAAEFSASQESAKVAALQQLDEPVSSHVTVDSVTKGGPADTSLSPGDVIQAVDGTRVTKPQRVAELVTEHKPGERVRFTVIPADKAAAAGKKGEKPPARYAKQVTVRTEKAKDDGRALVGIIPGVGHTFPFEIDIKLADVGGPSAGLMFALGIVDKLTKGDLTGGEFVAGTGTIDERSEVGAIGGIQMKTVAARSKGARFFLTPEGNCATAARTTPDGLTLVKVATMDDAMDALKKIRAGDTDKLTECQRD